MSYLVALLAFCAFAYLFPKGVAFGRTLPSPAQMWRHWRWRRRLAPDQRVVVDTAVDTRVDDTPPEGEVDLEEWAPGVLVGPPTDHVSLEDDDTTMAERRELLKHLVIPAPGEGRMRFVEAAAKEYGVHTRTIQRDIAKIEEENQ
jgi:hypothetical protein